MICQNLIHNFILNMEYLGCSFKKVTLRQRVRWLNSNAVIQKSQRPSRKHSWENSEAGSRQWPLVVPQGGRECEQELQCSSWAKLWSFNTPQKMSWLRPSHNIKLNIYLRETRQTTLKAKETFHSFRKLRDGTLSCVLLCASVGRKKLVIGIICASQPQTWKKFQV